ncbi:MAG: NAD(P)/FAD-dependent oxidoreductase [Nitrososphaera sp.]
MTIGVPREIKDYENRVALTPRSVASLVASGIKVAVERDAGARSGFSDADYVSAGAQIAKDAAELYSKADLVVKVKELQVGKAEHAHVLPRHVIFGYNHFESSRELTDAAVGSGATFISFEKVVDGSGQTPLLMPMSRIAGTLAGVWAGFFHNYAFRHDRSLRMKAGADQIKTKFIEDFERITEGKVDATLASSLSLQDKQAVIFGGGTAGEMAARACHALGAKLTIIEKRESRRKHLQELGLGRCSVVASADYDAIRGASAIIGATYDKEKADRVIDEKTLGGASEVRKKVIIDISIDQGGNFPFVDSTGKYAPQSMGTIMSPAQMDYFGNVFVRVPNMPSIVPRYASMALSNAITDHVRAIATGQSRPELVRATSIAGGKILDEAVARAHNMPHAKVF